MPLSNEEKIEIQKLIRSEITTKNAQSRVYARYPQGNDGYDGEMRISQDKYGVTTFSCFANKRWHHVELDMAAAELRDFGIEVAMGRIPGFAKINKFGEALDCDSGVPTDLWDGANGALSTDIWVPPTQARIHALSSSSANDAAAGTGLRTCKVYGLTSWTAKETSETVTMNGTGNTNTTNSYVIIHRIKGLTWGTGGVNAGDITATAATDATITAGILAGQNQTQMMIYGWSSLQDLHVKLFQAELVKNTGTTQRGDAEILYMSDPATNVVDNTAWTKKENFLLAEGENPWTHQYDPPKSFPGPGIVKIQVTANTNGTKAIGAMDAYLADI